MAPMDLETLLGSVSLFASLDRRAIAGLAQQASRRTYAAGEAIVREGDPGTALYVIVRGRVRVERGSGPMTAALTELGPGDFFGELALIEDHPRSASVVALEETECLLFVVWEFRALLKEHPQMALPIMNALIARLHRAEH
jgi:CRP/FNR family transcriptional regulator, cyclic AMP receptor protein